MSTVSSENTESAIKNILEERVRPMVALHRGHIDFVSFENGIVRVRLDGTCKGCPLSRLTLKEGVEVLLKDALPEVASVEAID